MIRASHESAENNALMPRNRTSESETSDTSAEKIDRDRLLEISSALVDSLDRRHRAKVFRSSKHDPTKLAYARALIAALQCHGSILKDLEQEEVKDRLSRIEAALEIRERDRKYREQIEREYAKRR